MATNDPAQSAVFNLRLQFPAALRISAYHWNIAYIVSAEHRNTFFGC